MYCVNCGVELADTEQKCPLCQTRVFHPDIERTKAEPLYPNGTHVKGASRPLWPQVLLSWGFLLPMLVVLLCDRQINGSITWSGYVVGALLLCYVIFVLPTWFHKPNPVIFVPCGFVAAGVYLLYINQVLGGDWFLSFAFPVVGGIGLIVTAVVTLMRYVPRGGLYIFGGMFIGLGAFMLLVEFLLNVTFHITRFIGWSLYPLVVFVLLGGLLIYLGICRPAREMMERKFFI